jgi:hypothetical protein
MEKETTDLMRRLMQSAQLAEAVQEHYVLTMSAFKQVPREEIEAEIATIYQRIRAEWQSIGKLQLAAIDVKPLD